MPAWTFTLWPLREQPDELLAELYSARAPLDAEAAPDDPRPPLAQHIAAVRNLPAPEDGLIVVARDAAGAIAGFARCLWQQVPGWAHVLHAEVAVLPGWRRQGLGRRLVERAAEVAQQRGLRVVLGQSRDSVPFGAAFCQRFGAEAAMVARENRLDLRTVDRQRVERWIAAGPVRAPGYRLQFVAGRTPPEMTGHVADAMSAMNTAPRENLDVSDIRYTADLVRAYEDAALAAGEQPWAYYAVEESSGRFVGLTMITIRPGTPDRVWVGDTGVDPAHRGQGLGKWLKAAITRRILDDLPGVRWVITRNAGSNDAMLAINERLGFRAVAVHTTWQVAAETLQASLAVPDAAR